VAADLFGIHHSQWQLVGELEALSELYGAPVGIIHRQIQQTYKENKMGKFVDSIIAYRVLKLLVTPFDKTDAFKMGIIDDKGNELKRMRDLNTVQERDAYTLLHRLVYRLKRIIEKVPIANKQIVSLAAAYSLIKESLEEGKEPIDLELKYINKVKSDLNEELVLVEEYLNDRKMFTFKQFSEDGEGAVAANNAAVTPGIAGLPPDQVPISKKRQKKWVDSNSIFRRK
jgi:hypothetical protein